MTSVIALPYDVRLVSAVSLRRARCDRGQVGLAHPGVGTSIHSTSPASSPASMYFVVARITTSMRPSVWNLPPRADRRPSGAAYPWGAHTPGPRGCSFASTSSAIARQLSAGRSHRAGARDRRSGRRTTRGRSGSPRPARCCDEVHAGLATMPAVDGSLGSVCSRSSSRAEPGRRGSRVWSSSRKRGGRGSTGSDPMVAGHDERRRCASACPRKGSGRLGRVAQRAFTAASRTRPGRRQEQVRASLAVNPDRSVRAAPTRRQPPPRPCTEYTGTPAMPGRRGRGGRALGDLEFPGDLRCCHLLAMLQQGEMAINRSARTPTTLH